MLELVQVGRRHIHHGCTTKPGATKRAIFLSSVVELDMVVPKENMTAY
jgi:hypothetical protein